MTSRHSIGNLAYYNQCLTDCLSEARTKFVGKMTSKKDAVRWQSEYITNAKAMMGKSKRTGKLQRERATGCKPLSLSCSLKFAPELAVESLVER